MLLVSSRSTQSNRPTQQSTAIFRNVEALFSADRLVDANPLRVADRSAPKKVSEVQKVSIQQGGAVLVGSAKKQDAKNGESMGAAPSWGIHDRG